MRMTFTGGRYVVTAREARFRELRDAGFIFNRANRTYSTDDWKKAHIFRDYADDDTFYQLEDLQAELEKAMSSSYAMFADADIPVPYIVNHKGEVLDYLGYQKAGIVYATEPTEDGPEREDVLIADSPGLGKTIQAIGIINAKGYRSGVIVCPATLKLNWLKEMTKWLVDKDLTIGVAYGGELPDTDFVIINYDILDRNKEALWAEHWDILVCDEAQYLANGESKRTKVIFGEYVWDYTRKKKGLPPKMIRKAVRIMDRWLKKIVKVPCLRAEKRIMLTGTPMMKQPKDMWPMIRDFDPDDLGASWDDFAMTYCDGIMTPFGLQATGGSNLDELNEKLRRKFMIRRLKANVLKNLPPKTHEVIVLPAEGLKKKIKTERDKFTDALSMLDAANDGVEWKPKMDLAEVDPGVILDTMTKYIPQGFNREDLSELDAGELTPGFAAYSEARRDLALSKVPMAVEHINRLLSSGEKVLVFAIHKDVISELYKAFPQAGRIVGGMGVKKVEADKLRFQGDNDNGIAPDPECNIMLLNLKAGGVGHTLTEATIVVFLEMWSVPGDMEQCEDRAHRIGLEHNVLIQFLVVDGTMDAMTIQTLIDRIEMIQQAVDGQEIERKAA